MEQTAVEWFAGEIKGGQLITNQKFKELFKQAKEMEDEQRKNDFRAGWHGNKHKDWNCEFYLIKHMNKDFKSK
jgi:hypothetical protein